MTTEDGRPQVALTSAASGSRSSIPYPKTMVLMTISTIVNLMGAVIAAQGEGSQICGDYPIIPEKACLTPYSYFVIWMTVCILLAMANDLEADIVLMFATIMLIVLPGPCTGYQTGEYGHCTLITLAEGVVGFGSPPILAAATLLVFARCLEETKAIEKMIIPCLAGATNEVTAVARLAFPTFFFSSFLNSTPIVAMLIPVCETWCAKSGFKLTTILMPLSFSAMLGGLTSLVGTASNMVLNAQIGADEDPPIEQFGFFTQAPAGVPAAIAGLTVMAFLAPILLGNLGQPSAATGAGIGDQGDLQALPPPMSQRRSSSGLSLKLGGKPTLADEHVQRGYELEVMALESCELLGKTLRSLVTAGMATEAEPNPTTPEGAIAPLKVMWFVRKDGAKYDASNVGFENSKLEAGDKLGLSCSAAVVPALRKIRGLPAAAEAASAEIARNNPKRRCLYEVALTRQSPLVGLDTAMAAGHKALQYTVLWAVRTSPMELGMSVSAGRAASSKRAGLSAKMGSFSSSFLGSGLQVGDTLLLEADDDFAEVHKSDKSYSFITLVPGSLPAAVGDDAKPAWLVSFQFYSSIIAMVVMVIVSIWYADAVPILPLSFLLMFALVAIGCITPDQAWRSIKYRVILTIMAAFGLGDALDNTDVADIIAMMLVHMGQATGPWVFLVVVFMITALLSFLVGSTPAIILLYAAVRLTGEVPDLKIGQSMMAMMLGAVCALATPVGFATNLMVQARAGYVFGDFFLLGSVVTMTVCLVSCSIILILPDSMLPAAVGTNTTYIPGMGGIDYIGPMYPGSYPMAFDAHLAHFHL